jgi:DNA-binding IclR family transcriptional regulator
VSPPRPSREPTDAPPTARSAGVRASRASEPRVSEPAALGAPPARRPRPAPERATLPGLAGLADADGDRQFAIALARGLEVLRAFTAADRSLSNRELCDRTGLPKATVSRLTHTLTLLGYLSRGRDQRVALGAGVLALAYPMLAGMPIRQVARPWLEQLARETGCTVNLGTRERLAAVYLDSCRADRANAYRPDIGTPLPLLPTAMGRALILARAPAEQAAILNRLQVADPARFRAESQLLEAEREAFRRRGWTHAVGQWRPGVHAIAMPLAQSVHPEPVAINCTLSEGPPDTRDITRRLPDPARLVEEVAPRMIEIARRIERACQDEPAFADRSPRP